MNNKTIKSKPNYAFVEIPKVYAPLQSYGKFAIPRKRTGNVSGNKHRADAKLRKF